MVWGFRVSFNPKPYKLLRFQVYGLGVPGFDETEREFLGENP